MHHSLDVYSNGRRSYSAPTSVDALAPVTDGRRTVSAPPTHDPPVTPNPYAYDTPQSLQILRMYINLPPARGRGAINQSIRYCLPISLPLSLLCALARVCPVCVRSRHIVSPSSPSPSPIFPSVYPTSLAMAAIYTAVRRCVQWRAMPWADSKGGVPAKPEWLSFVETTFFTASAFAVMA
jgi:hypothetical protein